MPLPMPKIEEEEKDFMSRCMGDETMNTEYPDQKQRAAICYTQWGKKDESKNKNEKELKTAEIKNVEIFEVGNWKGIKYTDDDLDQIVKNFKAGVVEPRITIDHSTAATKQWGEALGGIALGYASDVRKVGKKLVADFKQVPIKLAQLIKTGALKKRSIELVNFHITGAGEKFFNVLTGVTFTGGVPALNQLSDVFEVYYTENAAGEKGVETIYAVEGCLSFKNDDFEGELEMDEIKISKAEYDELVAFKAAGSEVAELKVEVDRLKDVESKYTALQGEHDALVKKIEQDKMALIDEQAEQFKNETIKAGKVVPAFADDLKADYIRFAIEDKERLERFKNEVASRASVIPGQIPDNGSTVVVTESIFKDTDAAEVAIQEEMRKSKVTWEVARKKLFELK